MQHYYYHMTMKVSSFKKITSFIVSFAYFTTQIALGNQADSSIWAERRKKLDYQMAAVPTERPQMPLPPLGKMKLSAEPMIMKLSSRLRPVAEAISFANATIQDTYDSGNNKNPPIVIIQDIHLNHEAQNNIAATIQSLIDEKQIGAVGVEGAFNTFNFAPFRSYEDKKKVKEITEAFVNKNLLAAPSYVGITSEKDPPLFFGVDERKHYDANVKAYLDSRPLKKNISNDLVVQERELNERKAKTFSPHLKGFDDLKTAYHKEELGIGKYLKELFTFQEPDPLSTLERFAEAYSMEQRLNFNHVEAERKSVIEILAKKLTKNETDELIAQSLAYRMGRMSFGRYYGKIKDLCDHKGIALHKTPAFADYLRYVLLADGIKAEVLFDDIEKLENEIAENLIKTEDERTLILNSEKLLLTQKLIDFSLTPKEWSKYNAVIPNQKNDELSLKPFEAFYEQADIRSHKMTEKLLSNLGTRNKEQGPAVLIVGGFHTAQMTQLFREQKISYIVLSPKITKIEEGSGSAYLTAFSREKTPLEKIFKGEKLFLALQNQNVEFPPTAARLKGVFEKEINGLGTVEIPVGGKTTTLKVEKTNDDPTQHIVTPQRTKNIFILIPLFLMPFLETLLFQDIGLSNLQTHVFSSFWLSSLAVATIAVGVHALAKQILKNQQPLNSKSYIAIGFLFFVFSLPFNPAWGFSSTSSFTIAFLVHVLNNLIVWAFRDKPWFPKWWPMASVLTENEGTERLFALAAIGKIEYIILNEFEVKLLRSIGVLFPGGSSLKNIETDSLPQIELETIQVETEKILADISSFIELEKEHYGDSEDDDDGSEELSKNYEKLIKKISTKKTLDPEQMFSILLSLLEKCDSITKSKKKTNIEIKELNDSREE
ncbi:MAG: hypothetical protein ACKVQC_06040, partial [Elusimicrobiota bacterium]